MRLTYDADHPDHEVRVNTDPCDWHHKCDDKPASPSLLSTIRNSQKHHGNQWPREHPDDTLTPAGWHWPHPRYTSTLYNVNTPRWHTYTCWTALTTDTVHFHSLQHTTPTVHFHSLQHTTPTVHFHALQHTTPTVHFYSLQCQHPDDTLTAAGRHWPHPWYASTIYNIPHLWYTSTLYNIPHPWYTSTLYNIPHPWYTSTLYNVNTQMTHLQLLDGTDHTHGTLPLSTIYHTHGTLPLSKMSTPRWHNYNCWTALTTPMVQFHSLQCQHPDDTLNITDDTHGTLPLSTMSTRRWHTYTCWMALTTPTVHFHSLQCHVESWSQTVVTTTPNMVRTHAHFQQRQTSQQFATEDHLAVVVIKL